MWPPPSFSPGHVRTIDVTGLLGSAFALNQTIASTAWPTANKIFYLPFVLPFRMPVKQLYLQNGTTLAGSVNMGIYTQDGTKLLEKGSTTQAGNNTIQFLDITDQNVGPGTFYLALQASSTTAQVFMSAPAVAICRMMGILMEAAASFALPAVATFAATTHAMAPLIGLLPGAAI